MARNDGATIADILDTGIIVACDEETGILVQGNGSYFNLYIPMGEGGTYDCRDCQPISNFITKLDTSCAGMHGCTAAEYWDAGKEALTDWLNRDCPECGNARDYTKNEDGERVYTCTESDCRECVTE